MAINDNITVGDWYVPYPSYPYYPSYPSYPAYTPPAQVHITTNWPSAAEIAQQKAWEAMEAYYKKLTEQLEASDESQTTAHTESVEEGL